MRDGASSKGGFGRMACRSHRSQAAAAPHTARPDQTLHDYDMTHLTITVMQASCSSFHSRHELDALWRQLVDNGQVICKSMLQRTACGNVCSHPSRTTLGSANTKCDVAFKPQAQRLARMDWTHWLDTSSLHDAGHSMVLTSAMLHHPGQQHSSFSAATSTRSRSGVTPPTTTITCEQAEG
jgi:hypothetical protein